MQVRDVQGSPNHAITAHEGANVNKTIIEISERTLSIIAIALAGLAVGISLMLTLIQSQSEARTRAELERQNRFLQEYRIRVEDAEIAAEEVNPKFHPRRTE